MKTDRVARWLTGETLSGVEWLPADLGLIEKLKDSCLWEGEQKS